MSQVVWWFRACFLRPETEDASEENPMTGTFNTSLTALSDCATWCDLCVTACLNMDEDRRDCIQSCLDCAEACRITSAFLGRHSELIKVMCKACAEICKRCAEHCEVHDDEHCRACADACRKAQEECEAIA